MAGQGFGRMPGAGSTGAGPIVGVIRSRTEGDEGRAPDRGDDSHKTETPPQVISRHDRRRKNLHSNRTFAAPIHRLADTYAPGPYEQISITG